MAETIERLYTIPLRKEWLKEPRAQRTKRSVRTVRLFIKRHTKADEIKISKGVNELIFSHGFKKPPAKIKVEVHGDKSRVDVKLPGEVIIKKKEEKKSGIEGIKDRLAGKTGEDKKEILKDAIQEKIKEETTNEKVKEALEKVQKQEAEESKKEDKSKEEKK